MHRHGSAGVPQLLPHQVDLIRAEAEYQKAINKLDTQARPQLETATPLMASYREKLLVLDNAIDELRAEAGQNPANAHLRRQLLAMYQEKQETLQEILETKR
jgi:antitoxin component HigA of HigAB toxin-antitoxin module